MITHIIRDPVAVTRTAEHDVVTCPYCNTRVEVSAFVAVTPNGPLVTAQCDCGRNLTMAAVTLERRTIHLP